MLTVHGSERDLGLFAAGKSSGTATSNRAVEPHCLTTHSGASRSVSPLRLRRETRFCEARKRASENW